MMACMEYLATAARRNKKTGFYRARLASGLGFLGRNEVISATHVVRDSLYEGEQAAAFKGGMSLSPIEISSGK
jgi:hypothetical protein